MKRLSCITAVLGFAVMAAAPVRAQNTNAPFNPNAPVSVNTGIPVGTVNANSSATAPVVIQGGQGPQAGSAASDINNSDNISATTGNGGLYPGDQAPDTSNR